jgi:eukaryotic-like serine/threonine-protein kinase
MDIELNVINGPCVGKVYRFEEPQGFTFGRAKDCTCPVENDKTFSRHHFLLEVNPQQVWLRDLGSLNGTYVNGQQVGGRAAGVEAAQAQPGQTVLLHDGDLIKAGCYELKLKMDTPVFCVDCGTPIPKDQRKAAELPGGAFLCNQCKEKEAAKKVSMVNQAGGDIPKNPQNQFKLNQEQRARAEENPGEVIDELLKQFFEKEANKKEKNKSEYPEIMGYHIEKKLGEGGFGSVYKATRATDGKLIAIKTILQTRKPEQKEMDMFEREKEISVALRHPNIIRCERCGCWNDIHFIEMEYMEGGCVGKLLEKRGKLPLDEAMQIMLQSLEGLAFAHDAELKLTFADGRRTIKGIIHRDLKPPNILLAGAPGNWTAKVSDFGLAKAFSEAGMTKGGITGAGMSVGSAPYMAPEHLTNYRNLKPATDVFEMAATFYHMLTGYYVWNFRKGVDNFVVILQETPDPIRNLNGSIPTKVAAVLDKSLSRKPEARYRNGKEMLEALKKAL